MARRVEITCDVCGKDIYALGPEDESHDFRGGFISVDEYAYPGRKTTVEGVRKDVCLACVRGVIEAVNGYIKIFQDEREREETARLRDNERRRNEIEADRLIN